jgi:LAO/AO transport system kinase
VEHTGLDAIWADVLTHRAKLERAGLFQERRRSQAVRWMWDSVNDHIQRALRETPAIRDLSAHLEAEVRDGRTTAAAASEEIVRALGLLVRLTPAERTPDRDG